MRRTQEKFRKQCKEVRLKALNLHVWSRRAQFNGLDQKLYEKIKTIMEREDKLCGPWKTTSKTKKLSLENSREHRNQLKENTEARRTKLEPEKDRLKRTKTVSYLTGTPCTEQRLAERSRTAEQEEAIAETASGR